MQTKQDGARNEGGKRSRAMFVAIACMLVGALAAGTLSASSTRDFALRTGAVSNHWLAYLYPVILEGGALNASVLATARKVWGLTHANGRLTPESAALRAFLLITVAVNVCDKAGYFRPWEGATLAGLATIVLLVQVDLVLRNISAVKDKRAEDARQEKATKEKVEAAALESQKRVEAAAARERARVERAQRQAVSVSPATTTKHDPAHHVATEGAQAKTPLQVAYEGLQRNAATEFGIATALRMLDEDESGCTGTALSKALGCSKPTARRYIAEAREQRKDTAPAPDDISPEPTDPDLIEVA